ncbi:hypothetical protein D3C87_2052540 [compost metagenome]
MPFLAAEAFRLENGDALKPDLLKRLLHLIELEGLDDRFDLLHAPTGLLCASRSRLTPDCRSQLASAAGAAAFGSRRRRTPFCS